MLRYLAAFLLIINIAFFAWMQGWLISAPQQRGRSPERLETQIRPDSIQVALPSPSSDRDSLSDPSLAIQDTPALSVPATPEQNPADNLAIAPGPTQEHNPANNHTTPTPETQDPALAPPPPPEQPLFFCIESGPLNGEQSTQLQYFVRQVIPSQLWEMDAYKVANSWAVYLGPYADNDSALKRQQELRAANIAANIVTSKPEFQPGITLALYREYPNAENHLAQIHERGIQEARIVVWSQVPRGQLLRIKEISEKQWGQLYELTRGANFPAFKPCGENNTPDMPSPR